MRVLNAVQCDSLLFMLVARCGLFLQDVKINSLLPSQLISATAWRVTYEGWNFNSGNYLFTTDTK